MEVVKALKSVWIIFCFKIKFFFSAKAYTRHSMELFVYSSVRLGRIPKWHQLVGWHLPNRFNLFHAQIIIFRGLTLKFCVYIISFDKISGNFTIEHAK